jgi:HD-GYP domain-containing protein (c-di-GMP phosphodiesterase class II)
VAREDIPLGARILAVADAYDAMTSDRPYRLGMPTEEARQEIKRCIGTQFDPAIVNAFLKGDPAISTSEKYKAPTVNTSVRT